MVAPGRSSKDPQRGRARLCVTGFPLPRQPGCLRLHGNYVFSSAFLRPLYHRPAAVRQRDCWTGGAARVGFLARPSTQLPPLFSQPDTRGRCAPLFSKWSFVDRTERRFGVLLPVCSHCTLLLALAMRFTFSVSLSTFLLMKALRKAIIAGAELFPWEQWPDRVAHENRRNRGRNKGFSSEWRHPSLE